MTETLISVRDVVLLVLASDKHPCNNIYDLREAQHLEAAALEKAATATPSPDDPPEFTRWLDTLRKPGLTTEAREAVYDAMYDYFEPEETKQRSGENLG